MERVVLEEIISKNDIDTQWFLPFLVHRLQAGERKVAILTITLHNVLESPTVKHQIELIWEIIAETDLPLQEHIVTEWAAYGIACTLIPLYTDFQVKQVAQLGEGFDYWIGDDEQEFGLEVSGTLTKNIQQRHRTKVQQFEQNPLQISGYVNVTGFRDRHSILSFHQMEQREAIANE